MDAVVLGGDDGFVIMRSPSETSRNHPSLQTKVGSLPDQAMMTLGPEPCPTRVTSWPAGRKPLPFRPCCYRDGAYNKCS
jgi:hypothetical protein